MLKLQKRKTKDSAMPEKREGLRPHPGNNRRRCIVLGVLAALLLAGGIVLLSLENAAQADTGIRQGTGRLSVDYEYAYNPNSLYSQPKPGEKEVRIAAYVKNMNFNMHYSLAGLDDYATESEVSVLAVLTAHASDTNKFVDPDFTVWRKEEVLLQRQKISTGSKIEKTVAVDVNKYLKYCADIIEQTKVSTTNELKLIFRVDTTVLGPLGPATDTVAVDYTIPMLDNLIVAQGTPVAEKPMKISTRPPDSRMSLMPFAVAAFALALGGGLLAFRLAVPKKVEDAAAQYRSRLEKVFRQYGERLVRLGKTLSLDDSNTIQIDGVGELIKIADEVSQPVFYYSTDAAGEMKTQFCVFDSGRIYRYEDAGEPKKTGQIT